jgi:hypothetical protein
MPHRTQLVNHQVEHGAAEQGTMQGSTGGRQGARVQDVGGRRGVVLAASALTAVAVLGAGGVAAVTGAPATPTTPSASPSSSPAATPPVATPPALVRETVQATRLHAARGDAFFEHATLVRDPAALTIVKDVGERLDPQEAAALLVVLPSPEPPRLRPLGVVDARRRRDRGQPGRGRRVPRRGHLPGRRRRAGVR